MIRLLLEHNANVNEKCGFYDPPLISATVILNELDIIKIILDKGADVNVTDEKGNTALCKTAANGNYDKVQLLLDSGADLQHQNPQGRSALLEAVAGGNYKIASLLIEKGADMDVVDKATGETVFSIAEKNGDSEMKTLLINANKK